MQQKKTVKFRLFIIIMTVSKVNERILIELDFDSTQTSACVRTCFWL